MSEQTEYLYYRDLFHIFKAYTTPKLIRVLDAQKIKYFTDANGKPFTTRIAIEGALQDPAASASSEQRIDRFGWIGQSLVGLASWYLSARLVPPVMSQFSLLGCDQPAQRVGEYPPQTTGFYLKLFSYSQSSYPCMYVSDEKRLDLFLEQSSQPCL